MDSELVRIYIKVIRHRASMTIAGVSCLTCISRIVISGSF
jgi:hypothetical protein